MSGRASLVGYVRFGGHVFPVGHWADLSRFLIRAESDPKGLFNLVDDEWNALPYAEGGRPAEAERYRFRFYKFISFLKAYIKWYCYQYLIGKGQKLRTGAAYFPYYFTPIDQYLADEKITCIDQILAPDVFNALWGTLNTKAQYQTRNFWLHLKANFGLPLVIPNLPPLKRRPPAEIASDESMVIPLPVIRQLANRLALHRHGTAPLNRFDHLRLCVVMLAVCVGRRTGEILSAPRLQNSSGPENRYPFRDGTPEGALWFTFRPNKKGKRNLVYISREWEELAQYCISELSSYSDEVREYADSRERDLLILTSTVNLTLGASSARLPAPVSGQPFNRHTVMGGRTRRCVKKKTLSLSCRNLHKWLNGKPSNGSEQGVLACWKITTEGSPDSPIFKLRLMQARHTRQTVLANDPQITAEARQRDLNHRDVEDQFAYQHHMRQLNADLATKMAKGELMGKGLAWLSEVLESGLDQGEIRSGHAPGRPSLLTPRMRALIRKNPRFVRPNRVKCGQCVLPDGPMGCREYMNCTDARDGGCDWFVTDVGNEQMMSEIKDRSQDQRRQKMKSLAAGRTVQAAKIGVLARRTELIHEEAMRIRDRLKEKLRQTEEEIWENE